ncbi:hypothetical protein [Helicobacter salomonis]|uniref:hypothetical protein n=1 Tax=Helicobacter salomonis TaxID=56878 RepID=UPI001F44DEDC|nr:hypothetical protein [Helicobacter salomonis]
METNTTSQIKGLYFTSENQLVEDFRLAWEAFKKGDRGADFTDKYAWGAPILSCFDHFKQAITTQEVLNIGTMGFYLPKDKTFCFVYPQDAYHSISKNERTSNNKSYTRGFVEALLVYFVGVDHYYSTEFAIESSTFNLEKVNHIVQKIYNRLPIARDKEHKQLLNAIQYIDPQGKAQSESEQGRYFYLQSYGKFEKQGYNDYHRAEAMFWSLGTVITADLSDEDLFTFFYIASTFKVTDTQKQDYTNLHAFLSASPGRVSMALSESLETLKNCIAGLQAIERGEKHFGEDIQSFDDMVGYDMAKIIRGGEDMFDVFDKNKASEIYQHAFNACRKKYRLLFNNKISFRFGDLSSRALGGFIGKSVELEESFEKELATIRKEENKETQEERLAQTLAKFLRDLFEVVLQGSFLPKQLDWLETNADWQILQAFRWDWNEDGWHFVLDDSKKLKLDLSALAKQDKNRAGIKEYDPKILSDANRGLWELWDMGAKQSALFVPFENPLIARNPKADIKNGLVGIDFGTASTVVVYQEESTQIHPMRVGLGDLSQKIDNKQYENPTIINFNDLTRFLESYKAQKGRPKTKWGDVNISHTAYSSMLGSPSSEYNSYLSELKQWAGNKHQKFHIADKQKAHFDLQGSLDLKEDDLNPIELYAYYLGLYINNQHHGIFLNYLLSFPVTYEVEVRQMILESFKKGIAKSLPNSLHSQGVVEQLKVEEGASEPAAYAIMALEGYGFDPSAEERVYYGVFDFGGGTTDFDFGLFQEAPESSRYDYILEHFGAGGDRYLGGENLLELASFEVFKRNKDVLLERHIPFKKPAEGAPFPGSEILLSESQEARINTKSLVEKLRPLWEGREFEEEDSLMLNLFNSHAEQIAGVSLDFSTQEVQELFKERIKRGVENFFGEFVHATNAYFSSKGDNARDINSFHIFLAGNASKSAFVTELFEEKIAQLKAEMEQEGLQEIEFIVHQPLGGEDLEKPNGKTGVAFGLIKARRGGSIQVIDYNVEENIKFKYFLGRSKKRKFYTLVARNQPYNEWVQFLDASESHFEVYYTSHASASTNTLSLEDSAIKKKALETGIVSENGFIFVRLVSPSAFEFVVATQEGLGSGEYLSEVVRVEL